MDEVHDRLISNTTPEAPFACFTFDDGYRDNIEHAYPVLKRQDVPATIYVPANYPDASPDLWWLNLERIIERAQEINIAIGSEQLRFDCASTAQKNYCYDQVYWRLRDLPEQEMRATIRALADLHGIDPEAAGRDLIMSWEEIATLARDPLITIGAHTCDHYALAKLPVDECARQIVDSMRVLEERLGTECYHFAYPYGDECSAGDREFDIASRLGLKTSVTTRKGVIHTSHGNSLMSLPRLSLNGDYQQMHYIDVLLSGAPFALLNSLSSCRSFGQKVSSIMN